MKLPYGCSHEEKPGLSQQARCEFHRENMVTELDPISGAPYNWLEFAAYSLANLHCLKRSIRGEQSIHGKLPGFKHFQNGVRLFQIGFKLGFQWEHSVYMEVSVPEALVIRKSLVSANCCWKISCDWPSARRKSEQIPGSVDPWISGAPGSTK